MQLFGPGLIGESLFASGRAESRFGRPGAQFRNSSAKECDDTLTVGAQSRVPGVTRLLGSSATRPSEPPVICDLAKMLRAKYARAKELLDGSAILRLLCKAPQWLSD